MLQLTNGQLITASNNETLKFWKVNEFKCFNTYNGFERDKKPSNLKNVFALLQINDALLAIGSPLLIIILGVVNMKELYCINCGDNPFLSLSLRNNGTLITCKTLQIINCGIELKKQKIIKQSRNYNDYNDFIVIKMMVIMMRSLLMLLS